MKKFGIFFGLLVVGYTVVNGLYLGLMERVDWNFSKAREAAAFRNRHFETLVFGNSTAMDGVNAAILSEVFGETYNFSLGGASLEANWLQFQSYLSSNQKPDRVLLFLSSCHIKYQKKVGVNPMLVRTIGADGPELSSIPLYDFRWLFVENCKKLISQEHLKARLVRGQLQMTRTVMDETDISLDLVDCMDQSDYSGDEFEYLWRMENLCNGRGIQFFVFEMPCWRRYQNRCEDVYVDIGDRKVRIYNLNHADICSGIISPTHHWLSENHLNYQGSIGVTKKIIEVLSNHDVVFKRMPSSK